MLTLVAWLLVHACSFDNRVRQLPETMQNSANGTVTYRNNFLLTALPEHLLLQRLHAGFRVGFSQLIELFEFCRKQVPNQQQTKVVQQAAQIRQAFVCTAARCHALTHKSTVK